MATGWNWADFRGPKAMKRLSRFMTVVLICSAASVATLIGLATAVRLVVW